MLLSRASTGGAGRGRGGPRSRGARAGARASPPGRGSPPRRDEAGQPEALAQAPAAGRGHARHEPATTAQTRSRGMPASCGRVSVANVTRPPQMASERTVNLGRAFGPDFAAQEGHAEIDPQRARPRECAVPSAPRARTGAQESQAAAAGRAVLRASQERPELEAGPGAPTPPGVLRGRPGEGRRRGARRFTKEVRPARRVDWALTHTRVSASTRGRLTPARLGE